MNIHAAVVTKYMYIVLARISLKSGRVAQHYFKILLPNIAAQVERIMHMSYMYMYASIILIYYTLSPYMAQPPPS